MNCKPRHATDSNATAVEGKSVLSRQVEKNRQMVANTAFVARSGIGAERLCRQLLIVFFYQELVAKDIKRQRLATRRTDGNHIVEQHP